MEMKSVFRRNATRVVAAMSVAALAVSLVACSPSESSPTPDVEAIKIAVPIELTGAAAAFGVPYLKALELAVEEVNAQGGIASLGGAPLELLVEDSQSDPNRAVQLLRKMHSEGAVVALGPASSGAVLAARATLSDLDMSILSFGLDDLLTEDNDGSVFRLTDRLGGAWSHNAFEFLDEQVDASGREIDSVGVVTISGSGGAASRDAITREAQSRGWTVTSIEYDPAQTRDFTSIVAQLATADVDIVMGSQYPGDSLLFVEAVVLQKWKPESGFLWLGGGAILNSYIAGAGEAVEDWMAVTYSVPTDACPAVESLAAKYEESTGEPLTAHVGAAPAAIQLIADALERAASTDPAAINAAIAESELTFCDGLYGLPGQVQFDEAGDNVGWVPAVIQIQDGRQVAVYPAEIASAEINW